jgi:hypothetical protein
MNLDLDDPATYSAICLLGPQLLWEDIMASQNNHMPEASDENGPFCILTTGCDNTTITFQNTAGNTW